jgi:hypothetical protein
MLTFYAEITTGRQARSMEARAAAIQLDRALSAITDVTELRAKPNRAKK